MSATAAVPRLVEPFRSPLDTHGGDDIYGVIRTSNDPTRDPDVRRPYVATLAEALAEIVDEGGRAVPVGGGDVDVDVVQEVESGVRRSCPGRSDDAVQVRELTTFAKLTEEMRRAEVMIASRFCALRLGRPTVSIGYAGELDVPDEMAVWRAR